MILVFTRGESMAYWLRVSCSQCWYSITPVSPSRNRRKQFTVKERATELLRANETLQSEIAYHKRAEEGLRQAQAELARVSRITAMGELTSSLAHEVNHAIGAMMINAETCLRWLSHEIPNVERARTIASMIVKDGTRASETVARMQQHFDKGAPLRETVDVNDVIREMVVLLRDEAARYAVSIRAELTEDLSQFIGDRAELKQVLMSLLINGIEAMKEGKEHGSSPLSRSARKMDKSRFPSAIPALDCRRCRLIRFSTHSSSPNLIASVRVCR